jgi:hypothetical protein
MNTRQTLGLFATAAAVAQLWRKVIGRSPTTWTPPQGDIRHAGLDVRVLGDGEPRLALLHGMFNSGAYWGERPNPRRSGTKSWPSPASSS